MGNIPYGSASSGLTYVNVAGGWRILRGLVCSGTGSGCGTIGGICPSGAGGIGAGTVSGCETISGICSSGGGGDGIGAGTGSGCGATSVICSSGACVGVGGRTGTSKAARSVGGGSIEA